MASILERVRGMIRGDIPPPPVATLVGFRILEVEPGRAVFRARGRAPARPTRRARSTAASSKDLADAAMGIAYASTLSEDESFTTLELKINFFKPVWKARLTATAPVVKRGKTIGMADCDVVDEGESLIARLEHVHEAGGKMAKGR